MQKYILMKTMGENRSVSKQGSNALKDTIKKSPKMIRYVFGDVRDLYLISSELQKMKSFLSGIRSFSKLLLTGLNPHIQ